MEENATTAVLRTGEEEKAASRRIVVIVTALDLWPHQEGGE